VGLEETTMVKIIPYSVLAATLIGGMVAAPPLAAQSDAKSEQVDAAPATSGKAATPAQAVGGLPVGTTICAVLDKAVDAKRAKPGDEIVARATLPVLWRGKIAIPNDAKIFGHITEAVPRSGEDGKSRLGIVFDKVVMKDGKKAPLSLTVQAIGMRPLRAESDDPGQPRSYAQPHEVGNNQGQMANSTAPITRAPQSPPMPQTPELPLMNPTLDAGSYGAIGMPDVNLIESKNAAQGSIVMSAKRNVKLDSATELVLRVIAADSAEETSKP
jgi:hypothetical protein